MASITEQLERLSALHKEGELTDEDYSAAKAKVLGAQQSPWHQNSLGVALLLAVLAAAVAHAASWLYFPTPLAKQHQILAVVGIVTRIVIPVVVGGAVFRRMRGSNKPAVADPAPTPVKPSAIKTPKVATPDEEYTTNDYLWGCGTVLAVAAGGFLCWAGFWIVDLFYS